MGVATVEQEVDMVAAVADMLLILTVAEEWLEAGALVLEDLVAL
jgi:hypothetical protein